MVKLRLPDGNVIEVEPGSKVREVASQISRRLEREAVGALLNGEIIDNLTPINESGDIGLLRQGIRSHFQF